MPDILNITSKYLAVSFVNTTRTFGSIFIFYSQIHINSQHAKDKFNILKEECVYIRR